ncbi:MAG: amino acid ABC transporter substrate-binding protein [Cyanobacteria bacterium J06623_7]
MNRNFILSITTCFYLFGWTTTAKAESTLGKIQRTGVLRVAIREDAAPFGFKDSNNRLQGYCLDFFALLKSQLTKHLERDTLSLKLLKSIPANRFSLLTNKVIDLECGPNTITAEPPEGTNFSKGFFITGTQFLVRRKNQLNPNSDLNAAVLGIIANTTTARYIKERYPEATILGYRGVTARNRGIQAVQQGKIEAMISDGILLRAEAQQQGLPAVEYPLVPELPLTCDHYGMIISANDSEWRDFINTVIDSPEAGALSKAWFGSLFNYILPAKNFC